MTNQAPSTIRKPVNVAVVGLGFMGVTHLRAYLDYPGARVVAVCGASRLPVNGILAGVTGNIKKSDDLNLGASVKVFRNYNEMLAETDIELVDICTPTALHSTQVIAALKAGKHVLCEKPLARTSAQAREVLSMANDSPGRLMPAMCMRFWPGWAWLKSVVAEQTYGCVLSARFWRASEMPAWSKSGTYAGTGNDSGGALFDFHIHDTDFVSFLFGRPQSVFSSGVLGADGLIHHVLTQYQFPNGPAVSAEGSWLLAQGFGMGYTLHCERATLDFDLARGADALLISEKGQPPRVMKSDGPDGYGIEIRHFLECVTENHESPVVTPQDAVTALEICEAEEKSIRTGGVVKL